jgi:hypothetical protein
MALGQALKDSEAFRLLDDGHGALCLMATDTDGALGRATNAACDRTFRAAMEMYDDFTLRRTSSVLLSAAFIAPDDRPHWFRFQIEATFQNRCAPRTILGKVREERGEV